MVSDQTKNYVIVALTTALIVLGLVWIRDTSSGTQIQPAAAADTVVMEEKAAPSQPSAPAPSGVSDSGFFKGDEDAPVTIVEFSDFQCPFCTRFYTQTLPLLEQNYINTGKVKLIYKDFPLDSIHPEATPAGEAAKCAGVQGKFWEMHDLLFDNQRSLSNANYKLWASELGLDTEQFNNCLDNREQLSAVRQDFVEGQQAGVRGTPAFLINGQLVSGAQPYEVFQQAIDGLLG